MPLKIADKKAIVADVAQTVTGALSIVAADYRGLESPAMTELRTKARASGIKLRVIRNTLARRALEGTEYECMSETLTGPTLLAFSHDEPGASARLLRDFAKDNDKLEVKSLSVGGKLYDKGQLNAVASLPTKEEALGTLLAVMQAPISKFVRTLAEPHAKLVRTLAAVRDKKQSEAA